MCVQVSHSKVSLTGSGFTGAATFQVGKSSTDSANTDGSCSSAFRSAVTQSENTKSRVWSFISSFITDLERDLDKSFNLPLPRCFTCNMKIIILVTHPLGVTKISDCF